MQMPCEILIIHIKVKEKVKARPVQAWRGPDGSWNLRLSDFKTSGSHKWQDCYPYTPTAFTP
jgi:hypothetical protein